MKAPMKRQACASGADWLSVLVIVALFGVADVWGECQPPLPGLWTIEAYEPKIHFHAPDFRGVQILKSHADMDTLYTGILGFHDAIVPDIFLIAREHFVFDKESCDLYGGWVFPQLGTHETLVWKVINPKEIHGYYVTHIAARLLLFGGRSLHIIKYAGPVPKNFTPDFLKTAF